MKICEYGCGQEAKYYFPTVGKWCCSSHWTQCPVKRKEKSIQIKEARKDPNSGFNSISYREELSSRVREARKDPNSKYNSNSYRENQSNKMKEAWKDPNSGLNSDSYRENLGNIIREAHKDPNSGINSISCRKKKSDKIKESWKDPDSGLGSDLWKEKQRKAAIKNIENHYGQCSPNYNPLACKLIDEYGKKYNYNFQHAENGGEFYIKELGYWVDGYDKEKNVVVEVDESIHFDHDGNLKERDTRRQKEIEEHLNCKFIRVKV